MSKYEQGAYILGTEKEELHRLGLQHQVWASEARRGWTLAGFKDGDTILDLGCGPGFCTRDLAYVKGPRGKAIGIDKSASYIKFLERLNQLHGLNMSLQLCDFDDMILADDSLDGVYCRWALAWIPNPEEIIQKVVEAMSPGASFVIQEYYDWSVFQTEPFLPYLAEGIAAALKSFKDSPGNIDIGRRIPDLFRGAGLSVTNIRPMSKLAIPNDLSWQWPKTFLQIYLPKLVSTRYLTTAQVEKAHEELLKLEKIPGSSILCPQMIEVIGVK